MSPIEWENLASLLSLAAGLFAGVVLMLRLIPGRAIDELDRLFQRWSHWVWPCGFMLVILSLAMCLFITAHKGIPQPEVHDEFSYLLAADTFSHGRITNPTPPFWEHFETPQQLMRPTYMSKYPPGQGLALALGQILFGKPIVGAWLMTASAVAAIYWMLLGFLPKTWSFLGGIVAALHPQLLDWSQMYWGGSLTVTGSALCIGAWGRLMVGGATKNVAVTLAAGLIIIANTRPFEGLVLIIPLMLPLMFRLPKQGRVLAIFTGIPLLVTALAMGYYNYRITGHFWHLPYLEYAAQYEVYPKFWFLPAGPMHTYRNSAMEYIHRYFELDAYSQFDTIAAAWFNTKYRLGLLFSTTVSLAVLLLPVSVAVYSSRETRLVWILIAAALSVITVWTEIFFYPHYLAPLFPAILLLIIAGWKKIARWTWNARPLGILLARAIFIGFLAGAAMDFYEPEVHDSFMVDQKTVLEQLPILQTGRHLIFVSYAPLHPVHWELVHNLSDLENSRIIWARSLSPDDDRRAAEHFKGRQIWSLYVGGKLDLKPFPPNNSGG